MPKERGQSCHFAAERQERKRALISPGDPTPIGKFSLGYMGLESSTLQLGLLFQPNLRAISGLLQKEKIVTKVRSWVGTAGFRVQF